MIKIIAHHIERGERKSERISVQARSLLLLKLFDLKKSTIFFLDKETIVILVN